MALSLGQSFHLAQDGLQSLRFVQCLVSRHTLRHETLCKVLVELFRSYASPAVNGEIPCNTNQPDSHITDCRERVTMFDDANKGVLNDIFSLGPSSQDGISYAE